MLWGTDIRPRWTDRLIVNLVRWMEHGYGEVGYYLTHFLTGNDHFNAYLYRMETVLIPACQNGGGSPEDYAYNTFFRHTIWMVHR